MLQIIFQAIIVEIWEKNTDSFNKTFFFKVKMKPPYTKQLSLK